MEKYNKYINLANFPKKIFTLSIFSLPLRSKSISFIKKHCRIFPAQDICFLAFAVFIAAIQQECVICADAAYFFIELQSFEKIEMNGGRRLYFYAFGCYSCVDNTICFQGEFPDCRLIVVSFDSNPRITNGIEVYPATVFLKQLWNHEII